MNKKNSAIQERKRKAKEEKIRNAPAMFVLQHWVRDVEMQRANIDLDRAVRNELAQAMTKILLDNYMKVDKKQFPDHSTQYTATIQFPKI